MKWNQTGCTLICNGVIVLTNHVVEGLRLAYTSRVQGHDLWKDAHTDAYLPYVPKYWAIIELPNDENGGS